ncbi:histidine phosphatase family protein [Serratia fonticola]|nr:histidine phosphatase family protein [Serratia fonticola]MDK2374935.1 histidine phosphatase family protein [Serratia fonticola]
MALLLSSVAGAAWGDQTLVFVRHGEKPDNHSGQLTCKGFNRALALPEVLISRFGKPEAIYAAGPKKNKLGSSMRALTTITPTAIRLSLPVNIQYHADDIADLQTALLDDRFRNAVVYVSWEHHNLVQVVKNIITAEGGDPQLAAKWPGSDFDGIYVLTIDHDAPVNKIRFERQTEGLNDVADTCPSGMK